MTDYRALCAELLHAVQSYLLFTDVDTTTADQRARRVDVAMNAVRAALAQPAPPAEGEVGDEARYLAKELRDQADDMSPALELFGLMHRAANLLAQRHPEPVLLSERLPGPEDCDAEGRCWWLCPPDFMELRSHATAESAFVAGATHWLPAHALPLPAGEVK